MIQMHELSELKIDDIKALIERENSDNYEFYIPKGTQRFFSDPINIAVEFLEAAYAGQKLFNISTDFQYFSPTPDDRMDFVFRFKCNDGTALANALLDISYVSVNDHPDSEFIGPEETEGLLDDIENARIIAACPDFIDLYYQFIAESEDEAAE